MRRAGRSLPVFALSPYNDQFASCAGALKCVGPVAITGLGCLGSSQLYPKPSERACMEVARTPEGYFVGLYGCPERTWSPDGGYTDSFVPLPVLNHRPA